MTAPLSIASSLLRVATAGSVDDGKSTLIGRLLFDSKTLFADQLEAAEKVSKQRGDEYVDLALLTDGLRAEREQGITIDVAYRYVTTPKRKLVIADTPGHPQYTRNMVTGASNANVAMVLIDARNGVSEQSRRHAFLASLLGVPHMVVCVNKMDLVDYSEEVFDQVREEFTDFAQRLRVGDVTFIPVSALLGDNVVERGGNTGWYSGRTLLGHLETLYVSSDRNLTDVRFPVQYVVRPHARDLHDYRGYAGSIASGVLRVGDKVTVLPSGFESQVAAIDGLDGPQTETAPPEAAIVRLADDLDISRGDMIVRSRNQPGACQDIDATVCWMDESQALAPGRTLALKHTTQWVRARVRDVRYRVDVNTLHRDQEASSLELNDIGRIALRTTRPLFADPYERNRATGSFILADEQTNRTVAAGTIR
ncbi:MAG: 50S ribosome-binding GTPase [Bifidobacteriaceae bacterium]|jgi:bifunctional enzyme CysN/CysC|nr:50S ribosome-binding GTPase [Bifidobacteriaceae bacterium]